MLNGVYSLTEPRRLEVKFVDVPIGKDKVIVRPTFLSICHADQRYYQGTRSPEIMKKKLPMALIHEGVGKVIYDSTGEYQVGEDVIMIPNTPQVHDEVIAENYLESSKFRASGIDGFMQDYVSMDRDRVISLPPNIDSRVAAFTELVSVSVHAISRFDKIAHRRRNRIGIWGDGNLGYITALMLHYIYPEAEIFTLGVDENKMADFTFVNRTYNVNDIPNDFFVDHAFECVGGNGTEKAINQIIDYIKPEGSISLLGVSENRIPINTRMILEKGLRFFGSSRSGRTDFEHTLELYSQNDMIVKSLQNLIGNVIEVNNMKDMTDAFEIDIRKPFGKTIMDWKV